MTRAPTIAARLAPLLLAMLAVLPAPARGEPDGACGIEAWARDGGVALHPAADPASPPLALLRTARDPATGERMSVEFTILEVRGGMARVSALRVPVLREGALVTEDSPLAGWVPADAVAFVAQTTQGFAEPHPGAARRATGPDWLTPSRWDRVVACRPGWAAVRLAPAEGGATLWVRGLCGNPFTTCDGVAGD